MTVSVKFCVYISQLTWGLAEGEHPAPVPVPLGRGHEEPEREQGQDRDALRQVLLGLREVLQGEPIPSSDVDRVRQVSGACPCDGCVFGFALNPILQGHQQHGRGPEEELGRQARRHHQALRPEGRVGEGKSFQRRCPGARLIRARIGLVPSLGLAPPLGLCARRVRFRCFYKSIKHPPINVF